VSDPQLKSLGLSPELHAYLVAHGTPPDAVQRELIEETAKLGPIAIMQVAPEQGAFLTLIARLIGAREAVEVGTFTGYSSLAIARGLAPEGRLLCCDVSEEWTEIARRAWQRAGVAGRIELRIAPAAETLRALPETPRFDLAFIDADKTNYGVYYEEILKRTRPGGLIMVDNVLWNGAVIDASQQDENTRAIRAFNDKVAADARVDCVMTPISDGLTLLRKRG
jgi:caffeoyl-CoA O-methyltransferase